MRSATVFFLLSQYGIRALAFLVFLG